MPTALAFLGVALVVFILLAALPTKQNMRTADHRCATESLLNGNGLLTSRGEPYGKTPPIYPVLLAGLRLLNVEWWTAVCLINALVFAVGLFAVHGLSRALGLKTSRYLCAVYLVFGPTIYLLRGARPDLIFEVAALGALAVTVYYLKTKRTGALIALSGLCMVAVMSRYMALFTLFPLVGGVLLFARQGRWWRKGLHLALFGLIACAPIMGWLVHTREVTGYWSGMDRSRDRRPADEELTTFENNVRFLGRSFYLDFFAVSGFAELNSLVGDKPLEYASKVAAILLGLGGLVFLIGLKSIGGWWQQLRSLTARGSPSLHCVALCAGYLFIYCTAMIALWTWGNNDPIDTRFLAPVYFCVVVVFAALLRTLWRARRSLTSRALIVTMVVGFGGVQVTKVVATWDVLDDKIASPWVEDSGAFLEAMAQNNLMDRIEERMRARGLDHIPKRLRLKLEAKGKLLERGPQKLKRIAELAALMKGSKEVDDSLLDDLVDELLNRDEAESEANGSDLEVDPTSPKGRGAQGGPPPLEHIQFVVTPAWPVYHPKNMGANFRLGYVLSEDDSGRASTKLVVSFIPGHKGDRTLDRWEEPFHTEDETTSQTPAKRDEFKVDGLSVKLIEIHGDYSTRTSQEVLHDTMLIGAVIAHPEGMYGIRAFGPRLTMEDQRPAIMEFIRSVRSKATEPG